MSNGAIGKAQTFGYQCEWKRNLVWVKRLLFLRFLMDDNLWLTIFIVVFSIYLDERFILRFDVVSTDMNLLLPTFIVVFSI